jgi:1,4-dihydroxy-2-naphthoate octaprenyltransferase
MVVSLALQVGTNFANDYSDGKRGTDDPATRVGPPRLVGSGLATPSEVKRAMLLSFGVALLAGFGLVLTVGWELIPVGLAAVAAGWFYTGGPRPYGYAGFGEVFVFVFFGLVATVGSAYVQTETITWLSIGCGVAIGSFATALLVVNNLRDIPGDTRSGKRTLAVRLGDRRTRALYAVLMAVPFLILPFLAGASGRPAAALAYLALPISTRPIASVLSGASGPALIPVLAKTARVELIFGVILAVGLLFLV